MKRYIIRLLEDSNGSAMLAVTYNGVYELSSNTLVSIVDPYDGLKMIGEISASDTSAFVGPLGISRKYEMSIDEGETNIACFSFEVSSDGLLVENNDINSDVFIYECISNKGVNATVTFSAYASASSTTALGTYESLFRAIELARTSGTGAVVRINDGTNAEVYCHGQSGRYYRYQFTASYGYVTSTSNADSWLSGYLCSHVVQSSNARMYGSNYTTAKGTPDSWALEPNSGGYYYQGAIAGSTYKKASRKVLLSQAKFKLSQNPQKFNAYIFFSIQNSSVNADLGLISGHSSNGDWKTCIFVGGSGGGMKVGDTVCTSTLNSNGEYVASSDVTIEVRYETGKVYLSVKNVNTGNVYTLDYAHASIGGSSAIFSSVSYVPDITAANTPDFRCGGYLKNIINTESRLYNSSNVAYDFYSTSATTNYSMRYNSDCCTLTTGSSKDTIDIFYDKAYRT